MSDLYLFQSTYPTLLGQKIREEYLLPLGIFPSPAKIQKSTGQCFLLLAWRKGEELTGLGSVTTRVPSCTGKTTGPFRSFI